MMSVKNSYYAFFDVDETVINIKSMLDFYKFCMDKYFVLKFLGSIKQRRYMKWLKKNASRHDRSFLNKYYYKKYKGMNEGRVKLLGKYWFDCSIKANNNFFNKEVLREMGEHKKHGAKIILVSGSFAPCLKPIADYLEISDVLCVKPVVKDGRYTGEIEGIQTIGSGKLSAIKEFLKKKNVDKVTNSFAYGDHISDIEMLEFVDNPRVVAGDSELEKVAKKRNWKILEY